LASPLTLTHFTATADGDSRVSTGRGDRHGLHGDEEPMTQATGQPGHRELRADLARAHLNEGLGLTNAFLLRGAARRADPQTDDRLLPAPAVRPGGGRRPACGPAGVEAHAPRPLLLGRLHLPGRPRDDAPTRFSPKLGLLRPGSQSGGQPLPPHHRGQEQQAQRGRSDYSRPLYWGAFVCLGDPGPLILASATPSIPSLASQRA
jgi:hypothetical protein